MENHQGNSFLVPPKNADASTGHIRFSGDVVKTAMSRTASRSRLDALVEIHGLVSHAKAMGQQGVVRKGVIDGRSGRRILGEMPGGLSVVQALTTQLEGVLRYVSCTEIPDRVPKYQKGR